MAIELPVLLFAFGVTLATTVLFSLAPALHAASIEPRKNLVESGTRTSAGAGRLLFRRGLVVAEVALSFVLVFGAGLMIRSFGALLDVDPGYRTDSILIAGVSLPASDYPDDAQVTGFFRSLTERASEVPGVESAAYASAVPLYSGNGAWDFELEGKQEFVDSEMAYNASFRSVSPGYFETMQIGLVRGRFNAPTDTLETELVALINEELVRRFFPDGDPLGQRIRIESDPDDPYPWMRVVGIVRDVHDQGLDTNPTPAYYAVADQTPATRGGPRNSDRLLRWDPDQEEGVWNATEETELSC